MRGGTGLKRAEACSGASMTPSIDHRSKCLLLTLYALTHTPHNLGLLTHEPTQVCSGALSLILVFGCRGCARPAFLPRTPYRAGAVWRLNQLWRCAGALFETTTAANIRRMRRSLSGIETV